MAKFREKQVLIDAFRWTGGPDQEEDPPWAVRAIRDGVIWFKDSGTPDVVMIIHTAEGKMRAYPGDWIVRGANGHFCCYRPDAFAATYEPVLEETAL